MAPKYRAPIFQLIDKELNINWYFGQPIGDIKGLDPKLLKTTTILKRKQWKGLIWQSGVLNLLSDDRYQKYLVGGELSTLSTWVFMLLRPIFAPKKEIFLWSHGWYGREGFLKKLIKRIFFGLADGTFLYGNYARDVAIEQGNDPDKFWVIHNSLDYDRHIKLRQSITKTNIYSNHFKNDNPVLIFIGRLTKVKKLHQVIEAVAKLSTKNEYFNLVLVGDGEESKSLEGLAARLNVPVWFYGGCYEEEKNAELIYNADLCVSPGNVGLTAIHTMTFGTPVLTHSNFSNQMPEFEAIKDGETGSFFTEDSIDSLASKISEWFEVHKHSRDSVRNKCYAEIDSFWNPLFQLQVLNQHLNR
ncbi:MAG: glycosyltransferase [Lachnospiraceae bacterium]|nr:glycosyltransferase [Lachnospiraceae bacterium]